MTDSRTENMDAAGNVLELPGRAALQNIWRRKWIVVAVTALCIAIAGIRLIFADRVYRATAMFFIEESGPAFGAARESRSNLYTHAGLLRSTPVMADALEAAGVRGSDTLAESNNPIGTLKGGLETHVGKEDGVITVTYDAPSPADAELILKAILDAYKNYVEKPQDSGAALLESLRREKKDRETELEEKTRAMIAFRRGQGLSMGQDNNDNLVVKQLASLSDAMTSAQLEALNAKSAYEEAARAINRDLAKVETMVEAVRAEGGLISPSGDIKLLQEELTAWQQRLRALRSRYLPEHPQIAAARKQIELLNLSYVAALRYQWESAQRRVAKIEESLAEQQQRAVELDLKAAEYARLEADVRRIERVLDALDTRIKELSVSEELPVLSVRVFEQPMASETPVAPRKRTMLFQALLLGLLLGCGATFLDRRLRSSEEVRETVGLPVLGVVPHMNGVPSPVMRMRRVMSDAGGEIAEAYRAIRTAVFFALRHDEARTLLICSPESGDGKSTLTCNLAIALAQAGQKVLLIDADFRRPALHRAFDIPETAGLSDILGERDTFEHVVQATSVPGLDLVCAGAVPQNPTELLNSGAFTDLIEIVSGKYDYVLIDAPPAGPVSDARILSALVDVTLLVVRADRTTRHSAVRTRDALRSVGANILGVVINDAPSGNGRYGLSGFDSYAYEPDRTPRPPVEAISPLKLSIKRGKTA
jgi:succinoglycan biosynthesis transport protein ExoP